ncbi:MAG: bifunctional UDP-N-acetylglucosamine diphosphorylase/glucosamine-1-phosphate N-acetyltransferase GlmU [Pseudomonadota bacterium]
MARSCLALILAAGEGTRMRSNMPKVMHKVAGLPMLGHVLNVSSEANCTDIAVVVGNKAELVENWVGQHSPDVGIFEQKERLGTGHAVLAARDALANKPDDILVLFGDTPLLEPATLSRMRDGLADGIAVVVLGFKTPDPTGYGRLLEENGKLLAIREHKDASEEERKICFCNGGIMALNGNHALELLDAIDNDNANKEYYLTDVVEIANQRGMSVIALEADETEVMGVNTRAGLSEVEAIWQKRRRREFMDQGVTMEAPETVFLYHDTNIEADVTLEPNVVFRGGVTVRTGANIRAFSHLEGADIGQDAEIGPYARLRPGVELAEKTKVGNFVEVKNSKVQAGAKINHLSYVGDSEVGAAANIGAGTITCNYDGMNKHKTVIGPGAFIGSNSSLVAPITIGAGAYVASGSVIVEDVPADGLAVARGLQANKEGRAAEIRERNVKLKASRNK